MTRAQYDNLDRRLLEALDRAYELGNVVAQDMGAVLRDTLRAGWQQMTPAQGAALVTSFENSVGIRPHAQPKTGQTTGQTTTTSTTPAITGQTTDQTTTTSTTTTPAIIRAAGIKLSTPVVLGAVAVAAAVYFLATRSK